MTDYSVINNVNVFVHLRVFIHSTSRCVLLESSTRTTLLRSFLGLLGETTPTMLGSRHRSCYDHICRILLKQAAEIDVFGSRCLDALVDTLCVPRRADKAIRLRHCRTASDGHKRDLY